MSAGRSSPADTKDLRMRLRTHILSGKSKKEFAYDNGVTVNYVYQLCAEMGFEPMVLTPEERKFVQLRRTSLLNAS